MKIAKLFQTRKDYEELFALTLQTQLLIFKFKILTKTHLVLGVTTTLF